MILLTGPSSKRDFITAKNLVFDTVDQYDIEGNVQAPPSQIADTEPFDNMQPNGNYWYGSEYRPSQSISDSWIFYSGSGIQTFSTKRGINHVWAVRDISPVPLP